MMEFEIRTHMSGANRKKAERGRGLAAKPITYQKPPTSLSARNCFC